MDENAQLDEPAIATEEKVDVADEPSADTLKNEMKQLRDEMRQLRETLTGGTTNG